MENEFFCYGYGMNVGIVNRFRETAFWRRRGLLHMKVREKQNGTTNSDTLIDGNLALNLEVSSSVFEKNADGKIWIDREKLLKKDRGYWYIRRVQDIILSLLALGVLCIPMLIIALVIWIDSPGASPIFKQTRVGRNGKTFELLKFRTMVQNAEKQLEVLMKFNEMDGPVFKIKEDPRITRVGRVFRKTSIDELPQLINILRGDMSIVGPRPALPREVEQYDEYERQRLFVQPGLTCYWQVQPNRNDLSFEEWMALDLRYISERSFMVDWKIIFATFRTVFEMKGI